MTGPVGPMSDFDFAVFHDNGVDGGRLGAELHAELTGALGGARVDIVVLNAVPVELAYSVIVQGRIVFERDVATRVEYEAYILGRYGDMLPILRAQRREIIRGGSDEPRIRRYREAFGRTERTLREIGAALGKAPAGVR